MFQARLFHVGVLGTLALRLLANVPCDAQGIPECGNDWEESAHFNEGFSGEGPYPERRIIAGQTRLTGFEHDEWQLVGNAAADNAHDLAFGDGVIEVRNEGQGVSFDAFAQYTQDGNFTQRIEIKDLELGGPLVGVMSVVNLFNVIVGGGDNHLVIQNGSGPGAANWQAFLLNQSALEGTVFNLPAGTDIAIETWFDEPSRTLRYFYDEDTTDAEAAELVATSVFTGPIDQCHRDQQLAFTSNGDPGTAYANADIDNWSFTTIETVPGDYNGTGIADALDYTFWRNSLGQTGVGLAADGNGDHVVDKFDYDMWKTSRLLGLAATAGSTTGHADVAGPNIPEPHSATLFLLSLLVITTVASTEFVGWAERRRFM